MATEIPTSGSSFGSTLTGVANLANLFLGSTQNTNTTTGGTATNTTTNSGGTTVTTNRESVAPGAVDAVVRQILEGTNGLAAVSGAQRSAGLYNSSTNQMLTNDLVSRAAGEAAKLNKETTQTTVTPQTTQTQTQNTAQTQSAVAQKVAPVSPGIALGGLAALQLIPKSMKDKVLNGISLKGFGSSSSAAATDIADTSGKLTAADVADPSGNGDFGFGNTSTGTDGLNGQTVAGIGGIDLTSNAASSVAEEASDSGGGDVMSDITGVGGDSDGTDLGASLGGFLSGIGDVASSAVDSASSWLNDFDFSFADGGIVNAADRNAAMQKHRTSKMADGGAVKGRTFQQSVLDKRMQDAGEQPADVAQPEPAAVEPQPVALTPQNPQERKALFNLVNVLPNLLGALTGTAKPTPTVAPVAKADGGVVKGYANGGLADSRSGSVYDLKGAGYIANTGIRAEGPQSLEAVGAESNDSVITRIIRDTSRLASVARPTNSNPLQMSADGNDQNITGYNSSAGGGTTLAPGDSGEAVEGTGIGSISGISGALGISSAAGRAGTNAALSALGISAPGLAGLANSRNNSEAVKSMGLTALGIVSPPLGLIATIIDAMTKGGAINGEADPTAGNKANALDGFLGMNDNFSASPGPDFSGGDGTGAEGGGIGGSGNSAGDGTGTGGGDMGGDGSNGAEGASAANGGSISGPGSGTSDSIPAKLSDGEYVISADVVEALGVPFFDKLQSKYHTPVKTGRAS